MSINLVVFNLYDIYRFQSLVSTQNSFHAHDFVVTLLPLVWTQESIVFFFIWRLKEQRTGASIRGIGFVAS